MELTMNIKLKCRGYVSVPAFEFSGNGLPINNKLYDTVFNWGALAGFEMEKDGKDALEALWLTAKTVDSESLFTKDIKEWSGALDLASIIWKPLSSRYLNNAIKKYMFDQMEKTTPFSIPENNIVFC